MKGLVGSYWKENWAMKLIQPNVEQTVLQSRGIDGSIEKIYGLVICYKNNGCNKINERVKWRESCEENLKKGIILIRTD